MEQRVGTAAHIYSRREYQIYPVLTGSLRVYAGAVPQYHFPIRYAGMLVWIVDVRLHPQVCFFFVGKRPERERVV